MKGTNAVAGFIKFILFVLLLPVLAATVLGFNNELSKMPQDFYATFLKGIFIYLLIHLFVVEPEPVYEYGHKIMQSIFKFVEPLVEVAPFFLPIYSLLLLVLFYFTNLFVKNDFLPYVFVFLISFTLTMHMVFTARRLREEDNNAAKASYLFFMSLIVIVNVFILAMMFNLIFQDFSFPDFFKFATEKSAAVYTRIFRQLFVP